MTTGADLDQLRERVVALQRDNARLVESLAHTEHAASRMSEFFERTPLAMVRANRTGRIVATNDAFARMIGRKRRRLEGVSLFDLLHPDDLSACTMRHALLLGGDLDHFHEDVRYVTDRGRVLWTRASMFSDRDASDTHKGTIGVIRDVTRERQARDNLAFVTDCLTEAADEPGTVLAAIKERLGLN